MVDAQAIDATELIVCVRDRTGRYVLVNTAFEELTGLPRERLHGKRDAALNPQDIADKIAGNDTQAFETGAPSEVDEELLGREGRVPVRSCRFAIANDEGEPWAVCSVSAPRDQVDRIRAERDRLAAIAEGTPIPHSAVTSKRLDALVSDLMTARETAAGLTEALEAERSAREEQSAELESERQAHAELAGQIARAAEELDGLRAVAAQAEAGRAASEQALAEAEKARAEAVAAAEAAAAEVENASAGAEARRAEADAAREQAEAARAEAEAQRDAAAAELERERAAQSDFSARIEAAEREKAELLERLEREGAAVARLSERVRSLESADGPEEGGLLHGMRLRHERGERRKAAGRADQEAGKARRLAMQLEAERNTRRELEARHAEAEAGRAELEARLAELAARREEPEPRLAGLQDELEALRAETAHTTAALDEARRDLERTRRELEAAREERDEARRAPAHTEAVEVAHTAASQPQAPTSLVWVQRRLADLVADASSFESAMRSALAAFGELAGWDAVVGWLPARDGAILRPANVWCSQAVAGSTFDVQSWQSILDDGPSAIAAAWKNDETAWIEDASNEDRPRCGWARAAGLTTAVAAPVALDGERYGMIEAYRREPGPRDEDVVAVLETIATQLAGLERMLAAGSRRR